MNRVARVARVVVAVAAATGCAIYDDTGNPDPDMYWKFTCPDSPGGNGVPVPATAPVDYAASGTCGSGELALAVDGCDMDADWSVLGLAGVTTTAYVASPGSGGWAIAATSGSGASWTCTAVAAGGGDLAVACVDATTRQPGCTATLSP